MLDYRVKTVEFEEILFSKSGPDRARALDRHTKRFLQLYEATCLRTKIFKMKSHLTRYGHDYLDTYGYLPGACIMSDERRQKLDTDVEEFLDSCHEKIKLLQSEILNSTESEQIINHSEILIKILKKILNNLFLYFNHLKTTKIVRQMEKQKYDRVECISGSLSPSQEYGSLSNDMLSLEKIEMAVQTKVTGDASGRDQNQSISFDDCQQLSIRAAEHDTSIDVDEIQALALENSQIHDELITLDDEVKLIGKKVVQISRLQEMFTEKVMEQSMDLDILHETAIKSSENVREGNDLIRDAMMRNASTRVFILFYVVTLGFSILFLDWYNP